MSDKGDLFVDMIHPDSGCALANGSPFAVFQGIFDRTNGNQCDGCAYLKGCGFLSKRAKAAHSRRVDDFGKHSHETNADIAKRTGMSKRQVVKARKKGATL